MSLQSPTRVRVRITILVENKNFVQKEFIGFSDFIGLILRNKLLLGLVLSLEFGRSLVTADDRYATVPFVTFGIDLQMIVETSPPFPFPRPTLDLNADSFSPSKCTSQISSRYLYGEVVPLSGS